MIDRIENISRRLFQSFGENKNVVTYSLISIVVVFNIVLMFLLGKPLVFVLKLDGLAYFNKAVEISLGDWSPMILHEMGWPVVMAPIIYMMKSSSINSQAYALVILNGMILSLSLIPFSMLSEHILSDMKHESMWAISMIAWTSILIHRIVFAQALITEPLFILLVLVSIVILTRELTIKNAIMVGIVTSFSAMVRPEGLFIISASFIYRIIQKRDAIQLKNLLIMIACIAVCLLPKFYMRYVSFGSLVGYGMNSLYFAANQKEAWSGSLKHMSIVTYICSTSPTQWFDRYVTNGLVQVVIEFFKPLNSRYIPNTIIAILGLCIVLVKRRDLLTLVLFFVWIAGLSFVFQAYHDGRYLFTLMPYYAISIAIGISMISIVFQHKYAVYLLASAVILAHGVFNNVGLISFAKSLQ